MIVYLIALFAWILFTIWALIEIRLKAAWWYPGGGVKRSEHTFTYWCYVIAKLVLGPTTGLLTIGVLHNQSAVESIGFALAAIGFSLILIGNMVWLSKILKAAKQAKEGMPKIEDGLLHLTKEYINQVPKSRNDST